MDFDHMPWFHRTWAHLSSSRRLASFARWSAGHAESAPGAGMAGARAVPAALLTSLTMLSAGLLVGGTPATVVGGSGARPVASQHVLHTSAGAAEARCAAPQVGFPHGDRHGRQRLAQRGGLRAAVVRPAVPPVAAGGKENDRFELPKRFAARMSGRRDGRAARIAVCADAVGPSRRATARGGHVRRRPHRARGAPAPACPTPSKSQAAIGGAYGCGRVDRLRK